MSTTKIDLPDGAWARLRDPEEITERQRRPLLRLQRRASLKVAPHLANLGAVNTNTADFLAKIAPLLDDEDFNALEDIDDLVIATLVEDWSYEQAVTVDGALDLPSKARRPLIEACRPLLDRLLGETSDDDVVNPDSPTAPANGSDRP